jgi:predicted nucleic acid-binding protein
VLRELEVGIQQVRDPAAYRSALRLLLKEVRIWPLELATTVMYGEIYNELRRAGRVMSQVDMMVAALARQMKLTVVTADLDYQAVSRITVVDWSV